MIKCALIYDFDGTLAEGDCAQHGLMPALGITDIANFWAEVKQRAQQDDGDEILAYLGLLAEKANGKQVIWPAQAINYTTKTQFLFRINKGILNSWNNTEVNKFIELEERDIPFERMIYFGDGDTDIPSMKMVRYQGGFSLAVFDEQKWKEQRTQEKVEKLIAEERANYVVPANYQQGSQLEVTVRGLLQLFKRKQ